MNQRLFLPLLATLLSGCLATGPIYTPVESVEPGNAVVYVYRGTGSGLGGRSAYFYVNDVNVFDLDQGGYSWVSLPPGKYKLKQNWPVDIPSQSTELDLEVRAGETRYFSFQTETCKGYICVRWKFQRRPPEAGQAEIADKRFQENFGAPKLKLVLDPKK